MSGDIREEDISALVAVTGQTRDKVIQALGVCCGDSKLAYQLMTAETKQSSTSSDQQMEGEGSGGSSGHRKPVIQETKFQGEGSGGGEGSQEIEGIAMRLLREDEGSIVMDGEGSRARTNEGEGTTRTRTSEVTGLWNDLQSTDFPISQGLKRKRRTKDNEYLTLKVIRPFQGSGQSEIHFRVKHTTQLGKLKRSYSERIGVPLYLLRFLYDGRRITDEHTPETLEMEPDDFVEVYDELGNTSSGPSIYDEKSQPNNNTRDSELTGKRRSSIWLSNDPGSDSSGESPEPEKDTEPEPEPKPKPAKQDPEPPSTPSPAELKDVDDVLLDLQKMKKKYENLVKKLRDKVECPVCLDVPKKAPIPVCVNGHVVCEKCLRDECPTCRARMDGGTSTLAVTVIENIEHLCEWEECTESHVLSALKHHMRKCSYRMVECPGLECSKRFSLSRLLEHSLYCCVERNEITQYRLPHKFTFLMKKDMAAVMQSNRDLNWKLEGIKFDDKIFFLKVSCERRLGRARWSFCVQMLGGADGCNKYTLNLVVCKGCVMLGGKYSKSYCGDVCPIDVSSSDQAYENDLCLTMTDKSMEKILSKNTTTGNYEFSVMVNIYKS